MVKIEWIPASKPPTELCIVLMNGGKYVVSQGVWWEGNKTNKPGFYLQAGELLFPAPWCEWWIPMPEIPE